MYNNLIGKKLLILGATADEKFIVEAARSMGVYTITTDNHTDWEEAPSKYLSDEAWDISWSDIPALAERCKMCGVDGVMAGYSEFRINCAIKLSKALGTKFYAEDEKVLEKTFDKRIFKDYCKNNGVPVTKDYFPNWNNLEEWCKTIEYPIVIKPTDNAGSRGIRTCFSAEEFMENMEYALSFSTSKNVVIEELVKGAREVVVYYTMADGEIALSTMCDKYERVVGDGFNSLPDAYMYPSSNMKSFVEKHNDCVIQALKEMGMRNGACNLQGFVKPDGSFCFFEMDYRPGGTNSFLFTEPFCGVNYLKMMISYSLTGNMHREDLAKENPYLNEKKGCIFTLLSQNGIITEQLGLDKVEELPEVIHTIKYHKNGTKIELNGSQFPKTFRAFICGDTIEQIKISIKKIQSLVSVNDENGNNMLFPDFNTDLLQ